MKYLLSLFTFLVLSQAKSQAPSIIGVYQADWGGPSYRYLLLGCDSTYHFITHWDVGGRISVDPPMEEQRKWTVDKKTRIHLEAPVYRIRHLSIQSGGYLRTKATWTKIITYDSACRPNSYTQIYTSNDYTITKLSQSQAPITSEHFVNGKLAERITYYDLSKEELSTLVGIRTWPDVDLIMQLALKLSSWPVEKIETWQNNVPSISYFDKQGHPLTKD